MRCFLVPVLVLLAGTVRAETTLPWQKWSPALFDRAAQENKYILLHMAAVWCHWCHVMEGTTYRDPAIQKAILNKFIPVRVDQDADPELSYRYEDWGWPATVMLLHDFSTWAFRPGAQLVSLGHDATGQLSFPSSEGVKPMQHGSCLELRVEVPPVMNPRRGRARSQLSPASFP